MVTTKSVNDFQVVLHDLSEKEVKKRFVRSYHQGLPILTADNENMSVADICHVRIVKTRGLLDEELETAAERNNDAAYRQSIEWSAVLFHSHCPTDILQNDGAEDATGRLLQGQAASSTKPYGRREVLLILVSAALGAVLRDPAGLYQSVVSWFKSLNI